MFPVGAAHEGDYGRIIGHLVAIPLVLKEQVRHSFDPPDLVGYLSNEDIVRL